MSLKFSGKSKKKKNDSEPNSDEIKPGENENYNEIPSQYNYELDINQIRPDKEHLDEAIQPAHLHDSSENLVEHYNVPTTFENSERKTLGEDISPREYLQDEVSNSILSVFNIKMMLANSI